MRPDPQHALRETLRGGPGHCPPDLFAGSVPDIVRGLKVHANQIHHSRHVAMEETFPRLRSNMGEAAFHDAANRHFDSYQVLARRLDVIGQDFAKVLHAAAERDLAIAEWAWLEALHAADALAISATDLASLNAEALLEMVLVRHPAARWVDLFAPSAFRWADHAESFEAVLITRPEAAVSVTNGDADMRSMWERLASAQRVAGLLNAPEGAPALFALIAAGAVTVAGVER